MAKQGDVDYVKNLDSDGLNHLLRKPFSDGFCGRDLMEIGALISLLPDPPGNLLDLGCGAGWTSFFFAKRGFSVTGVDISPEMIDYANKLKQEQGLDQIRFIAGDYESTKLQSEYDCVVFFDALHHSIDERAAIRRAYEALKPNGICICSEPGAGHGHSPAAVAAVKKYNTTERDMPPRRIISAGKEAGFRRFRVYPHASYLNVALYAQSSATKRPLIGKLLKSGLLRSMMAICLIAYYKRRDGIVVLTK